MEARVVAHRRGRYLMWQSLLQWAAGILALIITVWLARLVPGIEMHWHSTWQLAVFVPALAIINAVIRPFITLLALPINCMTFGLFSFVINSALFWMAGRLTGGEMNFAGALFGSIGYAFLSTIISWPIKECDN